MKVLPSSFPADSPPQLLLDPPLHYNDYDNDNNADNIDLDDDDNHD